VLVNAQHKWTSTALKLFDSVLDKVMVPTLNGSRSDAMGDGEALLSQAAVMEMKHFLSELLGGSFLGEHSWDLDHEVALALATDKLWHSQVKVNELPLPEPMLELALHMSLDSKAWGLTSGAELLTGNLGRTLQNNG
jgi:hypothetical protein